MTRADQVPKSLLWTPELLLQLLHRSTTLPAWITLLFSISQSRNSQPQNSTQTKTEKGNKTTRLCQVMMNERNVDFNMVTCRQHVPLYQWHIQHSTLNSVTLIKIGAEQREPAPRQAAAASPKSHDFNAADSHWRFPRAPGSIWRHS